MNELERLDRIDSALALEGETMEDALWWISFIDPERPEGTRFVGVCIVKAPGPTTALQEAWFQKCNPGGEASINGPLPLGGIDDEFLNRVLTKDEAMSIPEPS